MAKTQVNDGAYRLMMTGLLQQLPASDSPRYQADLSKWLACARSILDLIEVMEAPQVEPMPAVEEDSNDD